MERIKFTFLILIGLLIASCAVHNRYVPPHWRAQGAAAANIIIVVGFDTRSPCSGDKAGFHTIMLQSERTHGGIAIDVGMGLAWDYTNSAGKYSIARYSVRPGKYFLTNPATSSTTIITASEKIRLPFEVEAGKTYYLGNFEVYVLSNGKNIFGQTVPWGFIWLADKSAKPNRAAIKSKFPDVDADNMIRLEGNFSAPPYIFNDKSLIPKACLKKSS